MTEKHHSHPNEPKPKRTREEYLAVRKEHVEILKAECASYDKAVLQLSAGAIGVSIAFLDKLAKKPAAGVCWIGTAWGLLIASMAIMIFAFLFSQNKLNREIEELDAEQLETEALEELALQKHMQWFNISAGIFLVCGLVCLVVFAIVNLQ